jgi:hypothetical protein
MEDDVFGSKFRFHWMREVCRAFETRRAFKLGFLVHRSPFGGTAFNRLAGIIASRRLGKLAPCKSKEP